MASLGSVVIQFVGKDQLSRVAGKVRDSLGGVDDQSGKTTRSFGKLSAAWAAAIPVAGAVVLGAVSLANGLIEAGKAAMEDKNSSDKLARTLGNIKGVTDEAIAANEDWISSMQFATLVSDTDLRAAVGKLALATGDLGRAQELTTIAVDAAAGSGKNLSSVTDAMAKAANGNTSALKRLYPWLDKNKDGTLTLKEAQDGLKGSFKGAAGEAAKTRPWEAINTIMGELTESIGEWLLPVMEEFSDWFKNKTNQQKIQNFLDAVGDLAYELGEELVKAIKSAVAWLKKPENQQKIKDWTNKMVILAGAVAKVVGAIADLINAMSKIPDAPGWLKGGGSWGGILGNLWSAPAAPAAAGRAAPTPAPAVPQPTAVLVTEEQVYRAVARLMMRGDARNGRLVRVG